MKKLMLTVAAFAFASVVSADDKKPAFPVTLTLVAKTDKYTFDGGGKTPAEYKKALEELAKRQKAGEPAAPPKPPAVDLVLVFTNTSKDEVTIYVGGDGNTYAFDLTGDGTAALNSELAMTREFRAPKAVTLAAGKTHELPVKQLSDGARGVSRYVYWTGPGEYKLSVKYGLSNADGGKGVLLTSEPVKITVTEK